jgi:hypothetical protein
MTPATPTVLDARDLATRWQGLLELDAYQAEQFVEHFRRIGYLVPVNGNGVLRLTDLGREKAAAWVALGES